MYDMDILTFLYPTSPFRGIKFLMKVFEHLGKKMFKFLRPNATNYKANSSTFPWISSILSLLAIGIGENSVGVGVQVVKLVKFDGWVKVVWRIKCF